MHLFLTMQHTTFIFDNATYHAFMQCNIPCIFDNATYYAFIFDNATYYAFIFENATYYAFSFERVHMLNE